jgi:tetratricopeptide (TPR) repeat protein
MKTPPPFPRLVLFTVTAALFAGCAGAPPPSLPEICATARAGRFDEAQADLTRFLEVEPNHPRAHLLMAQFATDRPDAQPALALEHLRSLRPETRAAAALVEFTKGKAHFQQGRYDRAEPCWTEALRLDPLVPEAGWALFELLDHSGRVEEAHQLGIRMHENEPDPRDRVRLLLNLARLDVDKPSPGSQAQRFAALAPKVPDNLNVAVALGLAYIHDSRPARGVAVLREALRRHPDAPEAWDAWLTGLDDAGRPEELAVEFASLPPAFAANPRFAKHEGIVAQGARDWTRAVRANRRAVALEPFNGVLLYRLSRVLRQAGEVDEAERVSSRLSAFQAAFKQVRGVVDDALKRKDLGIEPNPELYQRLADLRERMGRSDEARAWHLLVLRDNPSQPISLAALERLK